MPSGPKVPSHWLKEKPANVLGASCGQEFDHSSLNVGYPHKTSAPRPGRLALPNTYRSCSVPAALFSESGTGSGWGSRQPGGTLVQPAQRHGVMRSLLPLCFCMKTVGIELTDVNHKWVAGLHLEQGSKYCMHHCSDTRGQIKEQAKRLV